MRLIAIAQSIVAAGLFARSLGFNLNSSAVMLVSTNDRRSLAKLQGLKITNRDTRVEWAPTASDGRYYDEARRLMEIAEETRQR